MDIAKGAYDSEGHTTMRKVVLTTGAKFRASMGRKLGIVVTRHDFCRFSVALTAEVPYGTIQERDQAHPTQTHSHHRQLAA